MRWALFLAAAGVAAAQVEVRVQAPPIPFRANDKTALVYELRIENKGSSPRLVKRIDANNRIFDGPALKRIVKTEKVSPGAIDYAFLWIVLDGDPPASIHNKIEFDSGSAEVDAVVEKSALSVVGPPLHGGNWMAANGPSNRSEHRRAMLNIDGHGWLAQRFAIDWVLLDASGNTHTGNAKDNKSYYAYGSPALAVADATVVAIKDEIPENVPGEDSRAVKITLQTIGGNHVLLDLGDGRFAFYGHLQPGSLRVRAGDRVKRGDVLGLVGNSGNSDEPHLHFHVVDRNSALEAEGVPFLIDAYESRQKNKSWGKRERALPTEDEIVFFP